MIAASVLVLVAVVIMYAVGLDGGDRIDEWLKDAGHVNVDRPDFFALDMLGVVVMIPALLLAVLVTGPRRIGYLTSVTGRMRWSWLGHTSLLAAIVFGGGIGALVALSYWLDPDSVQAPSALSAKVVVMLLLVLAITPFQAAAEEYVFRGYILQLVGSWTRFAWIPVVVSVPIFASGHPYNRWGLIDVGLFGLMAAYLVIRTGGLEASIAAHTFNNVAIMVFEALGMLDDSDGGGPLDLIPTIIMNLLFIALIERSVRLRGIIRTRPPIPIPPRPPVWIPPPMPVPVAAGYAPAYAPAHQPPPEWVPPANTPSYPGYLPPGWRPPGT
jgi:membrane protease YdiL (CAAX protease family)